MKVVSFFVPVIHKSYLNPGRTFNGAWTFWPQEHAGRWGISLAVFFVISGAAYWLMRARFINLFFTYTSLTKYWRRYMAPGIKPRDF
jgi:hypothetical protein